MKQHLVFYPREKVVNFRDKFPSFLLQGSICLSGVQQHEAAVRGPAGAVAAGGALPRRDRRLPARAGAAGARQPAR